MTGKNPAGGVVVVGVDGSEASKDALRWAMRYARMADAVVRVVTVWHFPAGVGWGPIPAIPSIDLEANACAALKETVEAVADAGEPVTIQTEVVEGPPALMLLRAAAHADLLVVGSRGHGAFSGMLLGSVSEHCVHHATCPVVVIRHSDPIVSRDVIGDPHSCVLDAALTQANGTLAKVFGWYDNDRATPTGWSI